MPVVKAKMMLLSNPRGVAGAFTVKFGTKALDKQELGILDGNMTLWLQETPALAALHKGQEFMVEITLLDTIAEPTEPDAGLLATANERLAEYKPTVVPEDKPTVVPYRPLLFPGDPVG